MTYKRIISSRPFCWEKLYDSELKKYVANSSWKLWKEDFDRITLNSDIDHNGLDIMIVEDNKQWKWITQKRN